MEIYDPLPRRFYQRDPVVVAPDLLGMLLVRKLDGQVLVGRIVEAEAYRFDDPASHAYRGETARNRSMFGPPGHAYVYRSYGIHRCLNAVTRAGAVLIRAAEPLQGMATMAARRGLDAPRLLCAGPGRLCQAFGIDLADDGADLCRLEPLWLARGERPASVVATPRVGITVATDYPWRFVDAGSPFASKSPRAGRLLAGGRRRR